MQFDENDDIHDQVEYDQVEQLELVIQVIDEVEVPVHGLLKKMFLGHHDDLEQ